MRKKFANDLYSLMLHDKNIILITADLGMGMFDKIRDNIPEQYYNVGCAEQSMVDIAVGMALANKIVVCYTITPFLFRAFEGIRLYINHESIPVKLVGSGRNNDYMAGFSHDASDHDILKCFKNIDFIVPEELLSELSVSQIIYSGKPTYLNLSR
jgi:transketolase